MTNKEFFIHTLDAEMPAFVKVIKALPADKLEYKPHEKARTAGRIGFQLASQWEFISGIVTAGVPAWGNYVNKDVPMPSVDAMVPLMQKNYEALKKDLQNISDEEWENGMAKLTYPGGIWEVKKYDMAWGFLFDAIHHRGQLTTYLRTMGEKVPSVYGGSADAPPFT